ncbi:MAG: ECF transporter S component [Erysipelotrichaceae bacterium]|nr:ECF transporter S component [Erysipelotrichaceae bacterium]
MTTKKMTTVGILCAMALVLAIMIYVPIVPAVSFLKYEPKDVIMVVGGFIYGPMTVVLMSCIVSVLEIFFRPGNLIDVIMNVISTVAFAGTAALVYRRNHTKNGAIIGLVSGVAVTVVIMILWNYIVTPIYYQMPREAVVAMMIPGIIPFNLMKYGLNAGITLVLYKPIVNVLRRFKMVESGSKSTSNKAMLMLGVFVVISIVGVILALQGII